MRFGRMRSVIYARVLWALPLFILQCQFDQTINLALVFVEILLFCSGLELQSNRIARGDGANSLTFSIEQPKKVDADGCVLSVPDVMSNSSREKHMSYGLVQSAYFKPAEVHPFHASIFLFKMLKKPSGPLVPFIIFTAQRAGAAKLAFLVTMMERFFSATRKIDPQTQPIFTSDSILLLSGPRSCGKTSLLFQFALNSVLESSSSNAYVVFICNRTRLENNPPFLSQGVDPSSDVFERIHMKYVEDDEGLKKYFAAFHLHEISPTAVIVDDFGDFFDDSKCQAKYNSQRGRDLAMVRTLALCRDAIMHANEKLDSGNSCKLLISDTYLGDTPRSLFIYKRWASSIFTTKGNGEGSYLLSSSSSSEQKKVA